MPRKRHSNSSLHGSMKYTHKRRVKGTSESICDRTGVHTTNKDSKVTCQFCLDIMRKQGKITLDLVDTL